MASLRHITRKLQRKNSKSYVFFIAVLLVICFFGAVALRYYAIEPLLLTNTSMEPRFRQNSLVWVCKLPQYIDKLSINETVWARLRNHDTFIRKIIGMPGDTLSISDKGKVSSNRIKFKWTDENVFIESRTFYIPQKGDTLYFSQMNDVEQDYIISYLQGAGEHFIVKTTLWQGDHEMETERIGSTKIGNRQVSLHEIDFLPWQDRYLIELQIRQSEPGNSPIRMKRELFRARMKEPPKPAPADTATIKADTATIKADTAKADTVSISIATAPAMDSASTVDTAAISNDMVHKPEVEIIAPLDTIIVTKDCYYIACERGDYCLDSRELGYFTRDDIIGRYAELPNRISRFVSGKLDIVLKELRFQKRSIEKFSDDKMGRIQNKIDDLKKWVETDSTKAAPDTLQKP